jgi:hypothetical protein
MTYFAKEIKMSIYDLEQPIMNCWSTQEDIELLYENIMNNDMSKDDISNVLLGIAKLHNLRSQKLFDTYEQQLSNA